MIKEENESERLGAGMTYCLFSRPFPLSPRPDSGRLSQETNYPSPQENVFLSKFCHCIERAGERKGRSALDSLSIFAILHG